MTTRKTRKEPIIKHDIFNECAKIEKVLFWKTLFEDFSKGHFPKSFAYKDRVLTYKRLRRRAVQKIDIPNDPHEAAEAVKFFVRKETGAIPADELAKKRIEMSIALKKNFVPQDQKWKDIRAPTVKRQLISSYVYSHVNSGALTETQAINLTAVIVSGLAIKAIKPEDIVLEDGKIIDIGGIDHDDRGFFLISLPETSNKLAIESSKPCKQVHDFGQWDKISQQYENYIRTGSTVK